MFQPRLLLRLFAAFCLRPATGLLLGIGIAFHVGTPPAWAAPATTTTLAVTSGGVAVTTVAWGSVITLTAAVKAGGTPVTVGQVNFCDASAAYCTDIHLLNTAQLTSAGTATFKFRPGIGSHKYKAVFAGTNDFAASTSGTAELAVTGLRPSIATIAQSGSDGSYTLTATVSGAGSNAPTGTVSFLDTGHGNAVLSTASLGAGTAGLSFSNPSNPAVGLNPNAIAAADFTGNGFLDLAVAGQGGATLLGNGDGTFTPVDQTWGGWTGYSFALGDFYGNGITDIAIAWGIVEIFKGDRTGNFTEVATLSPPSSGSYASIVAGDFNGDGIPDLAVTDVVNNTVTVLKGNGGGTFTPTTTSQQLSFQPGAMAVGDFNQDGTLDLAVLDSRNDTVVILLGYGDGTFIAAAESPATGNGPTSIAVADFSGSGIPDLAVANKDSDSVTVLLGNGDGTFKPAASPATGSAPNSLVVGDFNGDRTADLAVVNNGGYQTNYASSVTVLLGNGDGTFTPAATPATGDNSYAVVAGDFNGGGISGLAVVNSGIRDGESETGNSVSILLTAGTQYVTATSSGITLPVASGAHPVLASYSGDKNYGASTSAVTVLTAPMGTPTVRLTSSALLLKYGTPLTLKATVTGSGVTPTGTVTFLAGVGQLSQVALSGGVATFATSNLPKGRYSITASYSGDAYYYPMASLALSITVTSDSLLTPTVNLALPARSVSWGAPLTLKATVSGSGVTPNGTVTFLNGATQLGAGTLNSSGVASVPLTGLAVGSYTFTASYSGDTNYAPAVSAAAALTVTKAIQTITFEPLASPVIYGVKPIALTAGAASGLAVTFSATGPATVSGNKLTLTGTGHVVVAASQAGNADYAAASVSQTIKVNKATPAVQLKPSAFSIAYGKPVSFTATLTGAGVAPSGTVAFYNGESQLGAGTLNGSGVATFSTGKLKVGNHHITAIYLGDGNYTAVSSTAVIVAVTAS